MNADQLPPVATVPEMLQMMRIIESWAGTPFHHGQGQRGAGVDCAHFLQAVYHEMGWIPEFQLPYYPHDWMLHRDSERFLETIAGYCVEIPSPKPGDAIVWRDGRTYSHGAICLDNDCIAHAHVDRVVGIDSLSEFAGKPMKFWRVIR